MTQEDIFKDTIELAKSLKEKIDVLIKQYAETNAELFVQSEILFSQGGSNKLLVLELMAKREYLENLLNKYKQKISELFQIIENKKIELRKRNDEAEG
jgi:hypothetical protein